MVSAVVTSPTTSGVTRFCGMPNPARNGATNWPTSLSTSATIISNGFMIFQT